MRILRILEGPGVARMLKTSVGRGPLHTVHKAIAASGNVRIMRIPAGFRWGQNAKDRCRAEPWPLKALQRPLLLACMLGILRL